MRSQKTERFSSFNLVSKENIRKNYESDWLKSEGVQLRRGILIINKTLKSENNDLEAKIEKKTPVEIIGLR